ncbi:MAG: TIGR03862 family flavoprotein, partial [Burkholderiales bacterium]|nr:TIGR03862 family flavoprotein [Burkholderiales bacterium]
HSEDFEAFLGRYGARRPDLEPALRRFAPQALREWAQGLSIETFVGSSGRVFPREMKASPLLRAWLRRLAAAGVRLHTRHRWTGWDAAGTALRFATPGGTVERRFDAIVLALGGASWPRLGSDGAWVPWLEARGAEVAPLAPANCGFDRAAGADGRRGWSEYLRRRFAGQPVKPVAVEFTDRAGQREKRQGEFVLTETGVEGSLIYAFSARLRESIASEGRATIRLDLLPDRSPAQVLAETTRPRGPRSLATHLKSRLGIQGLKFALLHELLGNERMHDGRELAAALKSLALELDAPRPLAEAISSAGGLRFEALDERFMLRALPGVFCAGEMLDWEAPTGGYLLNGCLAQGRAAAAGLLEWWAFRAAAAA